MKTKADAARTRAGATRAGSYRILAHLSLALGAAVLVPLAIGGPPAAVDRAPVTAFDFA